MQIEKGQSAQSPWPCITSNVTAPWPLGANSDTLKAPHEWLSLLPLKWDLKCWSLEQASRSALWNSLGRRHYAITRLHDFCKSLWTKASAKYVYLHRNREAQKHVSPLTEGCSFLTSHTGCVSCLCQPESRIVGRFWNGSGSGSDLARVQQHCPRSSPR